MTSKRRPARPAWRGMHGVPVSLDVDTVYPGFDPVLRNVDYLVAGSDWPAKWTGETDPFLALSDLQREYGMRVAAMTLGDCGSLALADGGWYLLPAFEVDVRGHDGRGRRFPRRVLLRHVLKKCRCRGAGVFECRGGHELHGDRRARPRPGARRDRRS